MYVYMFKYIITLSAFVLNIKYYIKIQRDVFLKQ